MIHFVLGFPAPSTDKDHDTASRALTRGSLYADPISSGSPACRRFPSMNADGAGLGVEVTQPRKISGGLKAQCPTGFL